MLRGTLLKAADGNRLAASGFLKKIQKLLIFSCLTFYVGRCLQLAKYLFSPLLKGLFIEQNIYANTLNFM